MVRRAGLDDCGKSRPPPGSDSQTVRSVASHTNRATTAHGSRYGTSKRIVFQVTVLYPNHIHYVRKVQNFGTLQSRVRIVVGKPEGKRPFGRHRLRWEDNINMDLQEVGSGVWDRSSWLRIGTGGGHQ
jgi:hypothetical protein